jgi:hypothetical protein
MGKMRKVIALAALVAVALLLFAQFGPPTIFGGGPTAANSSTPSSQTAH